MTLAAFVIATVRDDIAGYVSAIVTVYTLLIIAYILSSMFFAFGGRVPYARWSSAMTTAVTAAARSHGAINL